MNEIKDFVEISKYAGERYDLVQAAGGNSSVKFDNGEMMIKASGFLLSDVNENSGFSKVFTKQVSSIIKNKEIINSNNKRERESLTAKLLREATIDQQNRPSIETLLHSLLLKYTLHMHPIVVNIIVSKDNYAEVLKTLFENDQIALVEYKTPGIELALALDKEIQRCKKIPSIIFLQNHGLIITSDNKSEIKKYTEYVLLKIEKYLKVDLSKYKLTNEITNLFNSIEQNSTISYLSEDYFLNDQIKKNNKIFFTSPFCPDTLVYCGIKAIELDDVFDKKKILDYKKEHHDSPKVIIYKNYLFFIAANLKKAKEMEEVYKFHIIIICHDETKKMNFLSLNELTYLSNWEAEKYRQKL